MPKKQKPGSTLASKTPVPQHAVLNVTFPDISDKTEIEHTVLLEDQIILFDDVLNAEECKRFVKFIDALPLELTPPKKRGEAERVNYRCSVTHTRFAERLYALLTPHLPSFPQPSSQRNGAVNDQAARLPKAMNPNIRMYRYDTGQYFGPHYDDSIRDAGSGLRSEWTLLIYLTGEEDGVHGGETLFHQDHRGKPRETITPPLRRGMALLHRHGNECMLHEGSPVLSGRKYVLRSDLLF